MADKSEPDTEKGLLTGLVLCSALMVVNSSGFLDLGHFGIGVALMALVCAIVLLSRHSRR
ncbi:hypothetical protein [Croceicoccus naphthovorans]|nr:hypothetical protein [Croceicoccus naphthovorans]MBB3991460.1 hypothetical protein [Croceicoccus naphthovorans]